MHDDDPGAEMSGATSMTGKTCQKSDRRGLLRYYVLLAVQTCGIVVLLINMLPLYRTMVLDFSNFRPVFDIRWALVGIFLVQIAYWLRVRLQPPLPRWESMLLGHLIIFIARMSFVSATAGFATMFLNRFEDLRNSGYPPERALIVLMIFFSLFCWTLELERLGKAWQHGKS